MRYVVGAGMLVAAALWPAPGRGGMIVQRTRLDGANAVRIGQHTHTLDGWLAFRQENPAWFAENRPRLGRGLALGKAALMARRAINPRRFDYYHCILGYLLADPDPDTDEPAVPQGESQTTLPPSVIPPGNPGGPTTDGGGGNPPGDPDTPAAVVPEPSAWVLAATGLAGVGLARLLRARRGSPRSSGPGAVTSCG
jgi:hypothetical protein